MKYARDNSSVFVTYWKGDWIHCRELHSCADLRTAESLITKGYCAKGFLMVLAVWTCRQSTHRVITPAAALPLFFGHSQQVWENANHSKLPFQPAPHVVHFQLRPTCALSLTKPPTKKSNLTVLSMGWIGGNRKSFPKEARGRRYDFSKGDMHHAI